MNPKREISFFSLAASVLMLTAMAKLYSATGQAKVLLAQDQLLHVGYRPLMILAALVEVIVAAFLLRSRSEWKRSLVLLWLSGNFIFYHLGNYLLGYKTCSCLGHLSDALPLPHGFAESMLQVLVLYWFAMSAGIFWREWAAGQWATLFHRRGRISPDPSASASPG